MAVLLFLAITTYGSLVLSGVVEEKTSRVVEVLLARVPARNLLAGKVAGIGLLGLASRSRRLQQIASTSSTVMKTVHIAGLPATDLSWAIIPHTPTSSTVATKYTRMDVSVRAAVQPNSSL